MNIVIIITFIKGKRCGFLQHLVANCSSQCVQECAPPRVSQVSCRVCRGPGGLCGWLAFQGCCIQTSHCVKGKTFLHLIIKGLDSMSPGSLRVTQFSACTSVTWTSLHYSVAMRTWTRHKNADTLATATAIIRSSHVRLRIFSAFIHETWIG